MSSGAEDAAARRARVLASHVAAESSYSAAALRGADVAAAAASAASASASASTATTATPLTNLMDDTVGGRHFEWTGGVDAAEAMAKCKRIAEPEIIVVGAGVIGCSAAAALGRAGRRVVVIERDLTEPDRIIGELMQPGGVQMLANLGLARALDNIDAVKAVGYAVQYRGEWVQLPYPEGQSGRSFHHGRFVMRLRQCAAETPNVDIRQGIVTRLIEEDGQVRGVFYKSNDGGDEEIELRAPVTMVCDGIGSRFRKPLSGNTPSAYSSLVGLVLEMPAASMPFFQHGHVVLADPSPLLVYALSPNHVRILIDVPHPLPSTAKGAMQTYMRERVLPQLPVEVQGPFNEALAENRFRSMNCNWMPGRMSSVPGAVLLGDSFNMRNPLTGGGMTVGLSDTYHMCNALQGVDLREWSAVNGALQTFLAKRTPLAATVNILSLALYKVFSASDNPILPQMREACFRYFQLGGVCASGPIRLLAGLAPNYYLLMAHFFGVALFGCARMLTPLPTPTKLMDSVRLVRAAARIVAPLCVGENVLAPLKFLV